MDTKTCTMCNIEKHMNNFYRKKNSDCRDSNFQEDYYVFMKKKMKYQIKKDIL